MALLKGVCYLQRMPGWERYQAWQLESRARYVATSVALRALIVFLFLLLTGSSSERASLVTGIFALVGILVWWFFYYPRAKAKAQPTSVPARTTQA